VVDEPPQGARAHARAQAGGDCGDCACFWGSHQLIQGSQIFSAVLLVLVWGDLKVYWSRYGDFLKKIVKIGKMPVKKKSLLGRCMGLDPPSVIFAPLKPPQIRGFFGTQNLNFHGLLAIYFSAFWCFFFLSCFFCIFFISLNSSFFIQYVVSRSIFVLLP
jgi:hypothetical protein